MHSTIIKEKFQELISKKSKERVAINGKIQCRITIPKALRGAVGSSESSSSRAAGFGYCGLCDFFPPSHICL